MRRKDLTIAACLFVASAIINLSVLDNYGLTWDFHYHFFSGARILGIPWQQIEPRALPYNPPDPRDNTDLPYGPLISVVPVAFYLLFHTYTGLLPDDVAYNLPIAILGSLGPAILYLFLVEVTKRRRLALMGAVFLAMTPRYFGDIHNDMKDAPMAVVFAVNVWLLWRLFTYRRLRDLLAAAVAFAVAFNTKINSVFIPILFVSWLAAIFLTKPKGFRLKTLRFRRMPTVLSYFLLAPIAALALWSVFWTDPIGKIRQMSLNFGVGTNNIEVLFNGHWYCSGSNVPWYYSLGYLSITTPLPILLLFGVGAIIMGCQYLRRKNTTGILLLLWLIVPLTRYLWPKIGVIDGIRHFEEVVFPIAGIAAVGAEGLFSWLNKLPGLQMSVKRVLGFVAYVAVLGYLGRAIIIYHPFQVTYFNELVGGLPGAMGKYDLDYWGTSQKKAIQWLNQHAPPDAKVYIVMAADVASRYLRPDLMRHVNSLTEGSPDYVVVLNRQSFFYRYMIMDYILQRLPVYIVSSQGVPLVWIYNNNWGAIPRQREWWHGDSPCIRRYWTTPTP